MDHNFKTMLRNKRFFVRKIPYSKTYFDLKLIRKNIFACLFNVQNTVSSSMLSILVHGLVKLSIVNVFKKIPSLTFTNQNKALH